jgi:hypothetical protein
MTSQARQAFDENCKDIDRLLEIHADYGGSTPGRRYGLEVLNKSAVVLITAFWEAYCEDLASEALSHVVKHAKGFDDLPIDLRKRVAKELKEDAHELAVWKLADGGWRSVLKDRLAALTAERNQRLNTPKTKQINDLFDQTLGIKQVSAAWYWSGMSSAQAGAKLDRYVTLRGAVAHRGATARGVKKTAVTDYLAHVRKVCAKTGGKVNSVVKAAAGSSIL